MPTIAIVGGGPLEGIPSLGSYAPEVDFWIGADEGAIYVINQSLPLQMAVGDFDSITKSEKQQLHSKAKSIKTYPEEKKETDLELSIMHAIDFEPSLIMFFGVTGGRIDHTLINIQLLYRLIKRGIKAQIIDSSNTIELYQPGSHKVQKNIMYPYISFIPLSETVKDLSLYGFYYPLENKTIKWGSTLCLSNKIILEMGSFSFKDGTLILIKSRDLMKGSSHF